MQDIYTTGTNDKSFSQFLRSSLLPILRLWKSGNERRLQLATVPATQSSHKQFNSITTTTQNQNQMRKFLKTTTLPKAVISFFSVTLMMIMSFGSLGVKAQSTVNYAFSTTTTGSLVDISSGSTTILSGASLDDVASSVQNIGFDFWFQGNRWTQFFC